MCWPYRLCCNGFGPPSCGTTSAVRTTGRCWSSPRPHCRTRRRPTPGIEDFLHRVRNRVGAVVPGDWTAAVRRRTRRRPFGADRAGRDSRRTRGRQPGAGVRRPRHRAGARRVDPGDDGHPRRATRSTSGGSPATRLRPRWPRSTCWCTPRFERREDARERRDWAEADAIRDRLKKAGIEVTDTADGPQWSLSGRVQRNNGRQFPAQRRGPQGRHQEGPARSAPAAYAGAALRAAAPRRRHISGPTIPPPRRAKRPRRTSSSAVSSKRTDDTEIVLGRNPVLECLRAGVPATALYVALGTDADERLTESVRRAADAGISILEVPRADLDRISANGLHQGIALQVPPYQYAHPDDLLASRHRGQQARAAGRAGQHLRSAQPRRDRAFGCGASAGTAC